MKLKDLNEIDNFDDLSDKGLLAESDEVSMYDLEKFDVLLSKFDLELVVYENGSALGWYIINKRKRNVVPKR